MAIVTTSLAFRKVDFAWVNPNSTLGPVTVNSLGNWYFPFGRALLESCFEVFGYVFKNEPEWNLVEAALWWPLLLILNGSADQSNKTVYTVTVARYFDGIFTGYIV